jgi:hypothetical protein
MKVDPKLKKAARWFAGTESKERERRGLPPKPSEDFFGWLFWSGPKK